jgi:tetratricopeptide (TPR) repeat protein
MADAATRRGFWMLIGGLALLVGVLGVLWVKHNSGSNGVTPPPPPDMAKVIELNDRGVGYMDRFQYAEAAREFEQITKIAPDWIPGRINFAIALFNQGGKAQAEKEKAGNIQPGEKLVDIDQINRAIQIFKSVLDKDPDNPHANYCLGFLLGRSTDFMSAIPYLERVTKTDPNDAGTWFQLGTLYGLTSDPNDFAKSVDCFEKAHRLNPYMVGPLNALMSKRDDENRKKEIEDEWVKLTAANALVANSQKYTEQGSRYARVIGKPPADLPDLPNSPLPPSKAWNKFTVKLAPGARWAKAEDFGQGPLADLRRLVRTRFGATIVTLDYDGDGRPDLFLVGAVVENGQVRDLLLHNDGNGVFSDVTVAAGLGGARPSLACAVADFDNDGFPDLLVTGAGVQKLFRNKGDGSGKFEDVSAKVGLDELKSVCLGAAWFDLDQDGDLDLFVSIYADTVENALASFAGAPKGKGGIAVYLNIGEAPPSQRELGALSVKFRRAPEIEKSLQAEGNATSLAVLDADGDVDLDVLTLADREPAALLVNDRLQRFHHAWIEAANAGQLWNGALVLDVDQDERSDLLLLATGQSPLLLMNRGVAGQDPFKIFEKGAVDSPPLLQARVVDFDLDGYPDVVGLSQQGKPTLLHNDRKGRLVAIPEGLGADSDWANDLIAVLPVDLDGDGFPDVLTWSEAGGLKANRNQGNGNRAVKVRLMGRRDHGNPPSERTNADGFGSRLILQSGRQWATCEAVTFSAGLGQSSEPVTLGLAQASVNDAIVRVRWPDMTVQAEFLGSPDKPFIDLKKENIWELRETNRKPVSCPYLLTWDGEKYVCVTDFLGEGSMGEMQVGGGTRPPRPEESVKIEAHQLRPRDGFYVMRIAEPMDELTYLDHLRLDVFDLPPGVDVFPDERFATSDPPATQERLFFKDRWFPHQAIDQRGRDVTALLRERDKKMVGPAEYRSWLGFAGEHWVDLDFEDQLRNVGAQDRLFLVLAGWTDYPYPESIFAAAQAGVDMLPPVLEKQGADGRWQKVCDVGFPAGMPKVITRDLTGLLSGFRGKLRLRTNLQIYWDQIFIAPAMTTGEARITELEPVSASLAYRGFLREISSTHSPLTEYDPEQLEPFSVTRWKGNLTRFGDVTELLAKTDDRFVIIGPGDEMTVRFNARKLAPLPAGWLRQFVLRSWGYCKDSSQFTATGGEVGPLPFRGMKQFPPGPDEKYPHPEDLQKWHTRRPN